MAGTRQAVHRLPPESWLAPEGPLSFTHGARGSVAQCWAAAGCRSARGRRGAGGQADSSPPPWPNLSSGRDGTLVKEDACRYLHHQRAPDTLVGELAETTSIHRQSRQSGFQGRAGNSPRALRKRCWRTQKLRGAVAPVVAGPQAGTAAVRWPAAIPRAIRRQGRCPRPFAR